MSLSTILQSYTFKHGGMIHHMAIRVGIGRHDPRGFPAAGIRTLLKSGGGVHRRLGLREACSSPEPIPSNLAIAGRKAFGLSVRDRHLGLLPSGSDRHLGLLLSGSDRHLRLLPSLVVTGDPMRSKRRACVARLAARAMWEGTRHQLQ